MCEMLTPEEASIPQVMAKALRRLPEMARPSQFLQPGDLAGLDVICQEIEEMAVARQPLSGVRRREKLSAQVRAGE
ncbi:MAG: hypothetical protein KDJ51_11660 [Nitratireductor sp.]|nr:hypothetical protein [Nitratireductor sp.]